MSSPHLDNSGQYRSEHQWVGNSIHSGGGNVYINALGQVHNAQSFQLGLHLGEAPLIEATIFVDRSRELRTIKEVLQPYKASLAAAIGGVQSQSSLLEQRRVVLGGASRVGKTQLAIAYAQQYRSSYGSIFWLNATSEASLQTSLRRLAVRFVAVQELERLSNSQVVNRVHEWLFHSNNALWLLIFDNYDELAQYDIRDYYPYVGHGSIVVTTRASDRMHFSARYLRVQPLINITGKAEPLIDHENHLDIQSSPPLPKMPHNDKKLPHMAIITIGLRSYMNSILQCLAATMYLSCFFLDDAYKENVQKNPEGSHGIMPSIYAQVIRSLWKEDVDMLKPTTFKNFCGRLRLELAKDQEQDPKRFLDFLIRCLHEDLNIHWEMTPLRPLTTNQESQKERMAVADAGRTEWQRYEHRQRSFISSVFAGQHASRLRCIDCKCTTTEYEVFYSISIDIPAAMSSNIYECLDYYCRGKALSEPENWWCPKCGEEASKQIIFTRLPLYLVIHFKRFLTDNPKGAKKNSTSVKFPLYNLDLENFTGLLVEEKSSDANEEVMTKTKQANLIGLNKYDAYAVLLHSGSGLDDGHFRSMVKDQGRNRWLEFDNDKFRYVNPDNDDPASDFESSDAYIVFYQRSPPTETT